MRRKRGYLYGLLATLLVLLLRSGLGPWLGPAPLLLPLTIPCLVAAYFGGWRAGLVTTLLNAAIGFALVSPGPTGADAVRVGLLFLNGLFASVVCGRLQNELRREGEKFRHAFEEAPIGMALLSPGGRWLRVNRALCDIVGYTQAEMLKLDFQTITHPDDLEADLDNVSAMLAGTLRSYQMEKRYLHKQGHVVDILLSVSLVRKPLLFVAQIQDISQRKRCEQSTLAALREKELMLREIHHRVKNNLQIVCTLLDLQSEHVEDPSVFQACRSRVRSMARVHERLYGAEGFDRVDFADYLAQLGEDLSLSYSSENVELGFAVHVPPLPIAVAIPCGMLINELVSNCLKHAFPRGLGGAIRVELSQEGVINRLVVADNGCGFPEGLNPRETPSFGLQLAGTLVEQLRGEMELSRDHGTRFVVTFPAWKYEDSRLNA